MSPSDIQRLINGSSSWKFVDREKEDNTVARYRFSDREGFTLAAKHEWKCKVTDLVTRPRSKK